MSNFDERKPPLPKGRGTTEGGGGIQKRDFVNKKIPQSASQTVFDPGRNYKLLPALAKNMPQAYFLYASRPLGKGALMHNCLPCLKGGGPLAVEGFLTSNTTAFAPI